MADEPDPAAPPSVADEPDPVGGADEEGWLAGPQDVWGRDPHAPLGPDRRWGQEPGAPARSPAPVPPGMFWQAGPPRRPSVGLATLGVLLAVAVLAGVGIGRTLPTGASGTGTDTPSAAGNAPATGSSGAGNAPAVGNAPAAGGASSGAAAAPSRGSSGALTGKSPSAPLVARLDAGITPALVDVDTTLGYDGLEAAGTGIVLTADGVVLTNNHVISGATSLAVADLGTHRHYTGTVIGYDESADVAVIRLAGAAGLPVAPIDTAAPRLGEQVVAVGNAGGRGGRPAAAGGTITGLDRSIAASDEGVGTTEQLAGLIETSADVQLGDSGGSLVDTAGRVVGMDTAAAPEFAFSRSGTEGFAVPIRTALSIVRSIEAGKGSARIHIGPTAFIGVRAAARQCSTAAGAGSVAAGSGAVVCGVLPDTPASRSSLLPGDLITAVGGHRIHSPTDLTRLLVARFRPGQTTTIEVRSDYGKGTAGKVAVTLGSGPPG